MSQPPDAFVLPHEFGMIQKNRRVLLHGYVDLGGKGLEIGPYAQPTVTKDEADISYLDVQTRAALIDALDDPELAARIPEVDYLCESPDYTTAAPGPFDYVIANHVLEHVPNPIKWLQMVASMLVADGILFLTLPDKKFTFDKYRPDTPLSHIVHDYFEDVSEVSMEHILENEMYYDLAGIDLEMKVEQRLHPGRLRAAYDLPKHPGWHCHVFRSETFVDKILRPLQLMELIEFELLVFRPARAATGGEFSLVLRRRRVAGDLRAEEFFTRDHTLPKASASAGGVPELVPRLALEWLIPRDSRLRRLLWRLKQRFGSR